MAASKVGKVTTSGVITEYDSPIAGGYFFGITTGPDGNVWYAGSAANKIGMVTTTGVFSEYDSPTPSGGPVGIIQGSNYDLWYLESDGNNVVRISDPTWVPSTPSPSPSTSTTTTPSDESDGEATLTSTPLTLPDTGNLTLLLPIALAILATGGYIVFDWHRHRRPLREEDPQVKYGISHHLQVVTLPKLRYHIMPPKAATNANQKIPSQLVKK
jgi:hypothetical protein